MTQGFQWWRIFLLPVTLILSLLVGSLSVGPITVMVVLMNTLTALVLLPKTVVMSIYTLLCTPRLGPKAKVFFSLLIWIPLVVWVPIVLAISLLMAFLGGLFAPVALNTVDFAECGCSLIKLVVPFKYALFYSIDFVNFSSKTYFEILGEKRRANGNHSPFELPISAMFLLVFGLAFVPTTATVIVALKLVPALFSAFGQIFHLYFKTSREGGPLYCCFCFFPFIFALFLSPIAVIGAACVLVIFSVFAPLYVIIGAHAKGFCAMLKAMLFLVYFIDDETNAIIFRQKCCSCFQCFQHWNINHAQVVHSPPALPGMHCRFDLFLSLLLSFIIMIIIIVIVITIIIIIII
jgi:hypothetical protein